MAMSESGSGSSTAGGSPGAPAQASNRIRETSKWLITVLGGVGGLLLAGTQLTTLGNLQSDRLAWAIAGLVVAIFGIGIALRATVQNLIGEIVDLYDVVSGRHPDLRDFVNAHPDLRQGYEDVEELASDIETATEARFKAWKILRDSQQPEPERELAKQRFDEANAVLEPLVPITTRLMERLRYEYNRRLFRKSLRWLGVGAGTALFGIAIFVWAANPGVDHEDEAFAPRLAVVALSHSAAVEAHEVTGPFCDLSQLQAVILDQNDTTDLLVLPTGQCSSGFLQVPSPFVVEVSIDETLLLDLAPLDWPIPPTG